MEFEVRFLRMGWGRKFLEFFFFFNGGGNQYGGCKAKSYFFPDLLLCFLSSCIGLEIVHTKTEFT